jgi:hypothetical protein
MKRLVLASLLALSFGALRAEKAPAPAAEPKKYTLDTCIVSGEKLDDSAKTFVIDGQEYKTCCGKCKKKVEADPKTFAKKLEESAKK